MAVGLARRTGGQPFDRTVVRGLGRFAGYPYLVLLAVLLAAGAPANLLVFTGVAHLVLLPYLPRAYVAVPAAAVGTYVAYAGSEAVARAAEVLAPFLAVGLFVIFAGPFFNAHLQRLLPLSGLSPAQWLSPPVLATLGTIRGFLPLLVLGPFCSTRPRARDLGLAATAAWSLITVSVVLPVAIFAAPLAGRLRYPFLAAEGTVGWSWLPLRNIVSLTLLVWYGVVFIVFATYLWLGSWLLQRLFPRLPWAPLVVILGAASAAGASLPLTVSAVRGMFITWNLGVVALGLLVPTVLWFRRAHAAPPDAVTRTGRQAS